MSKWIITVDDKSDERMREMEKSENPVWINEWVGEAVEVDDFQQMMD